MNDMRINKSALKHGISEADIRLALANFIHEAPLDDAEDKYLVVGFNSRGNLIEIVYETTESGIIHVFHAMRCRKGVLDLFGKQ